MLKRFGSQAWNCHQRGLPLLSVGITHGRFRYAGTRFENSTGGRRNTPSNTFIASAVGATCFVGKAMHDT